MRSLDPSERDSALLRLRRARMWIAAGAAALTGLASAAAAVSFRGHTASARAATSATPRAVPSGADAIPLPPSASDDPLQPPPDPPQAAPPDASAQTTSGGS
jgi:hypothetical protein